MNDLATQIPSPFPGVREFEALDIEPEAFSHEAHVYVGWQLLQECDATEAALRFTAALKELVRKFGFEDKYHETISWFFMLLIAERQGRQQCADWSEFAKLNADLIGNARDLLDKHYSSERLWSRLARRQFLLPDLVP